MDALLNGRLQVLVGCPRRICRFILLERPLNSRKLPPGIRTRIRHLLSDLVDLILLLTYSNIEVIYLLHQLLRLVR